jgi:hypothetical protein
MSHRHSLKRSELIGLKPINESAIFEFDEQGNITLGHAQIDLTDAAGNRMGSIVFNGIARLPTTSFLWAWKAQGDEA